MKAFFFVIGLILSAFLAYNYVPNAAQAIENNITESVTSKLVPQGLPNDVQIQVDGRDVTLTGFVNQQSETSNFVTMAQSVEGVRTVSNDLIVVAAAQPDVVAQTQQPIEPSVNDTSFDALSDDPSFEISEEVPEDVIVETVGEVGDAAADTFNEVEENIDAVAEVVTEDIEEMIEEPVIEAPVVEAPENAELEEVAQEASEEMADLVEEEPKKTASECQSKISALVEGKRINFETGQSKVDRDSLPLLDLIVEEMAGCADMALHIHGHTDNQGNADANRKISHARAKSVGLYLLKEGVSQRIKIFGHGDNQPIASNDTEAGREANRRIEFTVTDFDDSVATDDPRTVKTKKVPSAIKEHTIIAD
jgi:outer membrane protein OmpA-like peptidoglycan-associated protein